MKTKEVLEKLNIPKSTLHKYISDFSLNIDRNNKNEFDFSDDNIQRLETILKLKNDDNGIQTIQRILGVYEPDMNKNSYEHNQDMDTIVNSINHLESKFSELIDFSKEHSKASYQIGKLEAENRALNEKLSLLTDYSQKDITSLQNENMKLKQESLNQKEKLTNEIEELKAQLQAEKNKSFFQRLFNK